MPVQALVHTWKLRASFKIPTKSNMPTPRLRTQTNVAGDNANFRKLVRYDRIAVVISGVELINILPFRVVAVQLVAEVV